MGFNRKDLEDNERDDDFNFENDDLRFNPAEEPDEVPRFGGTQPPTLPPRQAPYRAAEVAPKKSRPLLWVLAFLVVATLIVVVLVLNQPTKAPTPVGQPQGLVQDPAITSTLQPTVAPSATPTKGAEAATESAVNALNQNGTALANFATAEVAKDRLALTPTKAPSLTPVPSATQTIVPAMATLAATLQAQIVAQDGKEAERQGAKPGALSCSVQKPVVFQNPNGNLQIDSGIVILLPTNPPKGWLVFVSNPVQKWDWNGTVGSLDNMRCVVIKSGLPITEATQAAQATLVAPPITPTAETAGGQPGG